MQPTSSRTANLRAKALSVLLVASVASACAGENLFSLAASTGDVGPLVDVTAPTEGFTIALGDSVLVTATVTANSGAQTASYRANYVGGSSAAFTAETESLGGIAAATLTNYLAAAAGQTEGDVYVVVEVTDGAGLTGADSVKVSVTN